MEMGLGYFITFEGIEGSGKTTQIRLLAEHLEILGYQIVMTREPGGCPVSDKIRSILLDADNHNICPMTELFMYAAARAQHLAEVIKPALESGFIVLCDRFTDATIAYQSCGRGIEREKIDTINILACQDLRPDLTVLIDCDPAIGLMRARQRIEATSGLREERFELETLEFHHRVREGYLGMMLQEPDRFLKIEGSGAITDIFAAIAEQVQTRLKDDNRGVC